MFKHTPLLLLLGLSMPTAANTVPDHTVMQGVEVGADLSIPHDLDNWLISEKYDGVRAYWDGDQLLTRSGYPIAVPAVFTAGWPREHLEGELWIGYGAFEQLSALVRSHQTPASAWQPVRFMLFDLPRWPGTFAQRQNQLGTLLDTTTATNLQQIPQHRGSSQAELDVVFAAVEARGGEGLMLHRASALYQLQRTTDLRKLKPFQDAEAKVIAHLPGKGKYTGMMGSLLVEQADGTRLRIGSGFSDAERAAPPAIGTILTFRYNGLTRHGKPRFARFLRIRPD
ncbi:DNA ligase-1 [Marinobacterium halophilum]|uniref:DNA ligase-1 n=1 Tax=Marinobacterium halophilum TaxID=267374 RepID=A0A2P8EVV9_9GAMM|nr:DNA ligase [Marinobacterium halophilum]PSL13613.1 DNA ligase-1 [Marinobacterium halophilum]